MKYIRIRACCDFVNRIASHDFSRLSLCNEESNGRTSGPCASSIVKHVGSFSSITDFKFMRASDMEATPDTFSIASWMKKEFVDYAVSRRLLTSEIQVESQDRPSHLGVANFLVTHLPRSTKLCYVSNLCSRSAGLEEFTLYDFCLNFPQLR